LVATRFKEQSFKTMVNRWMIGLAPKPQDVYDSSKNNKSTTEGRKRIELFATNCGTMRVKMNIG
jgi:hypothetical protein